MSDSSSKKTVEKSMVKPVKKLLNDTKHKKSDIEDFKVWLAALPSTPKLHINGAEYFSAVLVVDFGTPLEESVKMTAEQNAELVSKMKLITKGLCNKPESNIRIQTDSNNGIWWTTVN